MKKFLCRGKRFDGIWQTGYYFAKPLFGLEFILSGEEQWWIVPSTAGRYTGLTDKNGVKIFEGDIVKTKYGRLCVVTWFESGLCFDLNPNPITHKKNKDTKAPDKWDMWYRENLEVIGNIYDSLELIEG